MSACPREAMGRAAEIVAPSSSLRTDGGFPVAQVNDLSRSLTAFDPISTLVVVVEMSKASWLVSGAVPGVERQPLKKLEPDATALLRLIGAVRNGAGEAPCARRDEPEALRSLQAHSPALSRLLRRHRPFLLDDDRKPRRAS